MTQYDEVKKHWIVTIPELPDFKVVAESLAKTGGLAEAELAIYMEKLNEAALKEFSGKLILRIDPRLHKELFIEAKRANISINHLIKTKLQK